MFLPGLSPKPGQGKARTSTDYDVFVSTVLINNSHAGAYGWMDGWMDAVSWWAETDPLRPGGLMLSSPSV